jgi:predicted membrane protein
MRSYHELPFRYRDDSGSADRYIPALVLIVIGGLFLLDNLHIFYFHDVARYWPLVLVAVGLVKLVDSAQHSGRVWGGILLGLGALLLAQSLGYLDVNVWDLWPVILIGAGIAMLVGKLTPHEHFQRTGKNIAAGSLSESAVFGGGKRTITSPDFQGGEISAVFGGFELDLRNAAIQGEAATLDVSAVFGGVELKVPEHWQVEMRGAGVFGAFSDETRHPSPAEFPVIKRFILTGSAVFGGVVAKN